VYKIALVLFQIKLSGYHYGTSEWTVESSFVSWAAQLARALGGNDVEVYMQAISGSGVTRWPNMQLQREYTLGFDESAGHWDYSRFVPEAVFILLGPNDNSIDEPDIFLSSYLSMLDSVVSNYAPIYPLGQVLKIINVRGGSINGLDPCELIQVAVHDFNVNAARSKDGFQSYFVTLANSDWKRLSLP
jgi:hypothetical protein